ncbi:Histidine kinase-like ATPases [Proteiniphilum saccharofermentans]|uniref:Histidine kinase-like ATPases n=1 Tax=Proteiniphilum saccharofermentans TaxID=1642647 RepID=A0A1R3T6F8_9BACT|nr:ATP-binding protein [Proteiniphilum saccharofermentans]SCD21812.1 Histidine kinase-like ATPases [Proteiniphilum saccharofermentans]
MIDLAMHMMDIVQNSLRAGAQRIEIDLMVNSRDHTLLFRIKDDGAGMDAETVKKLDDPFFTTRTTRKVGLGVPFLKMTCEQTDGRLKVFSEKGRGSEMEAIYHTDHPDCLPLGDMGGYLALLLRANPHVCFRFTCRIDETEFILDSDELKKQGIELQHPRMLGAVREYIRENLREIYKKRSSHNFLCL